MVVVDLDGEGDMAVLIVCRYRTLSLSTYYIDRSTESRLHFTIDSTPCGSFMTSILFSPPGWRKRTFNPPTREFRLGRDWQLKVSKLCCFVRDRYDQYQAVVYGYSATPLECHGIFKQER